MLVGKHEDDVGAVIKLDLGYLSFNDFCPSLRQKIVLQEM